MTFPAGRLTHAFDFGAGPMEATAMSWADVGHRLSSDRPACRISRSTSELPRDPAARLSAGRNGHERDGPRPLAGDGAGDRRGVAGRAERSRPAPRELRHGRRGRGSLAAGQRRVRMQTCDGYSLERRSRPSRRGRAGAGRGARGRASRRRHGCSGRGVRPGDGMRHARSEPAPSSPQKALVHEHRDEPDGNDPRRPSGGEPGRAAALFTSPG